PAVAKAAMDTGVARKPIENFERYVERLEKIHGTREFMVRKIINRVKKKHHWMVFPEGNEEKILRASHIIMEEKIATPILLGKPSEIESKAKELLISTEGMVIIDPSDSPHLDKYAERLHELRYRKGVFPKLARQLMKDPVYYGMMMVEQGDADGLISGLTTHYPGTIKPALEVIGIRDDLSSVSSFYLVMFKDKTYLFADTTVNIDPTAEQLCEIALQCAEAAKLLGMEPKIAMLSFSNFGSVKHPAAQKVARAVKMVQSKAPELQIDGEMQADTAVSPRIMEEFFPFANIKGGANILIFPELHSANISYKLMEHLGQAELIGPILLGMKKPVNVLSRDCSVENIVNIAALTALEIDRKAF
ncbi:MAG: phosphate acyltransferase, partial [Spirochaetota bacterium]|nr:phosphate acyltransferase [Spirochaetota bacterium]